MRFACLGSGSRGNATLVQVAGTVLLVDCGFSLRETIRRLRRLGMEPEALTAILLTHEHGDHALGVARLAACYRTPIYATAGTLVALGLESCAQARRLSCHQGLALQDILVDPFPVPHDAREACQFRFSDGAAVLGLLTDAGHVTAHMLDVLSGCDGLILETNHDGDLLACGPYHPALKRRLAGDYGHLSNAQAAGLLHRCERSHLQHVVAAHLSEHNNRPELARSALADALCCTPDWIGLADQDAGLGWREL